MTQLYTTNQIANIVYGPGQDGRSRHVLDFMYIHGYQPVKEVPKGKLLYRYWSKETMEDYANHIAQKREQKKEPVVLTPELALENAVKGEKKKRKVSERAARRELSLIT